MGVESGTDIFTLLSGLEFWHWWILALALGGLEFWRPGVVFLWLGVAALIVGIIKFASPDLAWETQFILFAALSALGAIIGRYFYKRMRGDFDNDLAHNQRSAQYIGRQLTLLESVSNNTSRAHVDTATWAVRCHEPLPKGARVEVVDVDGIILIVKPFRGPDHEAESN